MCAFAVYACSGVTHHSDTLTACHSFAWLYSDGTEMCVQTVVARAAPSMLDYDVFAIVRVARNGIDVHNLPIGNSAHFIERLAICIAVHRPDIDSFVKAGVNDGASDAFRITDKAVLAAFPWC